LAEPTPSGSPFDWGDALAWARDHVVLVVGALVLLLLVWKLAAGDARDENGRYVLVKDDIPCQTAGEGDARRWCYLLLDTQTGRLEERVRRIGR
jgi:hypothetical protein